MARKRKRGPKKRPPSKAVRGRRSARPRIRAQRIDARAKTLAIGAEPPIDRDSNHLVTEFWTRLLYGSGRPGVAFGRPGAIVTNADGVTLRSNHQGNGAPGSGRAADCYPLRDGRVIIPAASDPLWKAYADAARAHGLTAGLYWPRLRDAPHCELPIG